MSGTLFAMAAEQEYGPALRARIKPVMIGVGPVEAAVNLTASHFGIPVSTTHVISTSIMGVGSTKGVHAVKWGIVGNMVWAWVLTIPVTALLGYGLEHLLLLFG